MIVLPKIEMLGVRTVARPSRAWLDQTLRLTNEVGHNQADSACEIDNADNAGRILRGGGQ